MIFSLLHLLDKVRCSYIQWSIIYNKVKNFCRISYNNTSVIYFNFREMCDFERLVRGFVGSFAIERYTCQNRWENPCGCLKNIASLGCRNDATRTDERCISYRVELRARVFPEGKHVASRERANAEECASEKPPMSHVSARKSFIKQTHSRKFEKTVYSKRGDLRLLSDSLLDLCTAQRR